MTREQEKQAARDRDLERLKSGEITAEELRRENGFASALPLRLFRIASIGDRKMQDIK